MYKGFENIFIFNNCHNFPSSEGDSNKPDKPAQRRDADKNVTQASTIKDEPNRTETVASTSVERDPAVPPSAIKTQPVETQALQSQSQDLQSSQSTAGVPQKVYALFNLSSCSSVS